MKEIMQFVRDLAQNNNREWFNANKPRYQYIQKKWFDFSAELISEVGKYDDQIAPLTAKDCTYRIYRDTRFSPDKTPYKTHFGVFLCPGGKKSMHAGYYFHVSIGGTDEYPHAHMPETTATIPALFPFFARTSATAGTSSHRRCSVSLTRVSQ